MSAEMQPAAPLSKGQIFMRRLLSSVILWSVIIGALFSGYKWLSDYVFLAIIITLAGLGLIEFYGLVEKRGMVCFKGWGIFGGLLIMVGTFFYVSDGALFSVHTGDVNDFETCFLVLFVLGLCVRQFLSHKNPSGLMAISTTLMGLMYVPWLLNFIQKINFYPHVDGHFYLLYFVLVTKFSDIGAYCTGSLIGKHKMIPRLSPGKTWEGFGGALVFSSGVSLAFVHFAAAKMPAMNWIHALALGLILSATAVVGDLIESQFKREAGVKDSGHFFPGIGGILDLLDSLLFNAPLMYLYMRYILKPEMLAPAGF